MTDSYPVVYKSKGKWIVSGETYLSNGILYGKLSSKFKIVDAVVSCTDVVYLTEDGKIIINNIVSKVDKGFKLKLSSDSKVVCVLYGDGNLGFVRHNCVLPPYKFKNIYMYSTYLYGILFGNYFITRSKQYGNYNYNLYDRNTGELVEDDMPVINDCEWENSIYAYIYIGILTDDSVKSWATFGRGFAIPEYLTGKKVVKIISKNDIPAYYILDNGKAVRHDNYTQDLHVDLQGRVVEIVDEYVLTVDKKLYYLNGDVVLSYIQGEVDAIYSNKIVLVGGLHIQL